MNNKAPNTHAATDSQLPAPHAPLTKETLQPFLVRRDAIAALYCMGVAAGMVLTFALLARYGNPWTFALAFVVIGAFQHHLSIIQHEAVHYSLFRRRWLNEFVGRLLGAYPVGFTMAYRRTHLAHHRRLGSQDDPDLHNFEGFPSGPWPFFCNLIKNMTGLAAIRQFVGMMLERAGQRSHSRKKRRAAAIELACLVVTQVAIISIFIASGHATWYLTLWLLPLVTVGKTLANLRNLAEHVDTSLLNSAVPRWRTIYCNPIEAFFFAPANFNYHAEHHLYPTVPFYHLPALHRELMKNDTYKAQIDIRRGFLRFLLCDVCFVRNAKPRLAHSLP